MRRKKPDENQTGHGGEKPHCVLPEVQEGSGGRYFRLESKGEITMYTDLMDAYGKFRSEKNWKNFKNLYKNAFCTSGISAWKLFRFAKNLLTKRYEKLYKNY